MQVSFGKLIQTKVYIDGYKANAQEVKDATNLLCSILRKDKGGAGKTSNGDELREIFQANVRDYTPIEGEDAFYSRRKTPMANVAPLDIPSLGTGRFLLTGKDIQEKEALRKKADRVTYDDKCAVWEDHYYQREENMQEKVEKLKEAERRGEAWYQDGLRALFLNNGLKKQLEIRIKTTPPPRQLSIFDLVEAPKKPANLPPKYKRYEIESLEFKPETLALSV